MRALQENIHETVLRALYNMVQHEAASRSSNGCKLGIRKTLNFKILKKPFYNNNP